MAYVLLVDDEPESITIASRYLASKGHRTAVLPDGREAIARLREEAPDVLVIETMMPFADGYMVLQELKQFYPDDRVSVIVITSIAADGEPLRDWSMAAIDSYVLAHRDAQAVAWQIVLTVEDLLNRSGQL
jgi:CheY-like chemotaxis protein